MNVRRVKGFCAAVLLFAACPPARAASSWEDESKEWEKLSGTRFYKDPGYAAKLSLTFLPVDNGHFYVGEVAKGVWFSLGETVSLAAVVAPVLAAQSRSKLKKDPVWTGGQIAMAGAGVAAYLGLKVWSAFGAAADARRYNAEQEAKRAKGAWRMDVGDRRVTFSRRF
jgi:hypothetical protein